MTIQTINSFEGSADIGSSVRPFRYDGKTRVMSIGDVDADQCVMILQALGAGSEITSSHMSEGQQEIVLAAAAKAAADRNTAKAKAAVEAKVAAEVAEAKAATEAAGKGNGAAKAAAVPASPKVEDAPPPKVEDTPPPKAEDAPPPKAEDAPPPKNEAAPAPAPKEEAKPARRRGRPPKSATKAASAPRAAAKAPAKAEAPTAPEPAPEPAPTPAAEAAPAPAPKAPEQAGDIRSDLGIASDPTATSSANELMATNQAPSSPEPKAAPSNGNGNGNGTVPAALLEAKKLRDVVSYWYDSGVTDPDQIVQKCTEMKDHVEVLKRLRNFEPRIRRALDVLGLG